MRNVIRSYTDGLFDNKDKVKKMPFQYFPKQIVSLLADHQQVERKNLEFQRQHFACVCQSCME